MINHVWGLFAHPGQEWQSIRGEEETVSHMYLTHVLLLAAIPAVSGFIGATQVGWSIGGGEPVKLTQASCMQLAVMSYLAMLAGVALFVGGLAGLYPHIWVALTVGTAAVCYTAYLLYVGLPKFMNIPSDEGFMFSSSVLAVGLVVLVAIIATSVIVWGMGMGPVYVR